MMHVSTPVASLICIKPSSLSLSHTHPTTGNNGFVVCQSTRQRPKNTRQRICRVLHTVKSARQSSAGIQAVCRVPFFGHTAKPLLCVLLFPRQNKVTPSPSMPRGLCLRACWASVFAVRQDPGHTANRSFAVCHDPWHTANNLFAVCPRHGTRQNRFFKISPNSNPKLVIQNFI